MHSKVSRCHVSQQKHLPESLKFEQKHITTFNMLHYIGLHSLLHILNYVTLKPSYCFP